MESTTTTIEVYKPRERYRHYILYKYLGLIKDASSTAITNAKSNRWIKSLPKNNHGDILAVFKHTQIKHACMVLSIQY